MAAYRADYELELGSSSELELELVEEEGTRDRAAERQRGLFKRLAFASTAILGLVGVASYGHQSPAGAVSTSSHHTDLVSLLERSDIPQNSVVQKYDGGLPPAPTNYAPQAAPAAGDMSAAMQRLAPREDRFDNNPCGTDEELFEGLCYMKCALLTNGAKPVRCTSHICEPLDRNGQAKCGVSGGDLASVASTPSILPCHGYDVAGRAEGTHSCPHSPGVCLIDEELSAGQCIKKCSILTNGVFPHRTAVMTCCKSPSILRCLMPGQSKTDVKFSVGGGANDGDKSTPATPHAPLTDITEAKTSGKPAASR
eukprot:TRINITY_DN13423_c0_g1_i2.p1 TRINITY_DN13423_c0_g1~~TRINITY_DN13423_c0_g1_i2.p1  ORF type:complete len:338 (+),score=58.77 TRINITY_DN13423_c0_g1_i2:82-1014(+)